MTLAELTLRWQRWLLAAMLFGSAVLVYPAAVEPFMLPKVTFLTVLAVVLLALGAARVARLRLLMVPRSPVVVAVVLFAVALILATLTSSTPWASAIGFYGRYTGLVPYLVYIAVFFTALAVTTLGVAWLLLRTGLVASVLVVLYGLAQSVGADPVAYLETRDGTTYSFFGNVNFSTAWVGCFAAACLAIGWSRSQPRFWRGFSATLLPLSLAYLAVAGTVQGFGAALLAVMTTLAVLLTGPGTRGQEFLRSNLRWAAGALAVAVGVLIVGGIILRSHLDRALTDRPDFWQTAVDLFLEHPFLGTGLDTYAHHFLANRPVRLALSDGVETTDAPHSVPLGMFSNGGVVLGLTYLAVVLLVGWVVLHGAASLEGHHRVVFAGFAGIWVAYQAQSLVSFDVPPLALLHWLSAGVIVSLAAPPSWRQVKLPGYRPPEKKRRGRAVPAKPSAAVVGVWGITALLSVVGIYAAIQPLRADLVAASAAPLGSTGQLGEAAERLDRASDLNPAEASYRLLQARALEAADLPEPAFRAAADAARRDPGTVQYALFAARQARAAGLSAEASRWYRNAMRRDPNDPLVLDEVAAGLLALGDPAGAEATAQRSASLRPAAGPLLVMAQVREGRQDADGAAELYQRVLDIEPENEFAARRLAQISASK